MSNTENVVPLPDISTIYSEASEWLVLLSDGDVSAEEMAEFKAWCGKSEKHREAFEERAALWNGFDHISLLNDYAASDVTKELIRRDATPAPLGIVGRRPFLSAMAATLLLSVGIGAALQGRIQNGTIQPSEFATVVGEQKEIELSDGSTVNLNSDSEIRIAYQRDARIIQLIRGEAYFDVERDTDRPFSVSAGDKSVIAIGTAFTVRRLDDKVDVTVTHGRVALFAETQTPQGADTGSTPQRQNAIAEIAAGQNAVFGHQVERIENVAPDVMARQLSWRDGVLAFAGDPLSKVVADVGRYTGVSIEIESEDYASLPISGYVKIGAYEEMFEALEIMAGLKAVRLSPKRVQLVKDQEG